MVYPIELHLFYYLCIHNQLTQVYSVGEVKKPKRRSSGDPFERFLARLDDSSLENDAGNASVSTLSDMPSISQDEILTPVPARSDSKVKKGKLQVLPYHKKYPSMKTREKSDDIAAGMLGRLSPGEVPRHIRLLHLQNHSRKDKVGHSQSTREVKRKTTACAANVLDYSRSDCHETNTLRNGIDVINISRCSPHLEHKLKQQEMSSVAVDDPLLVQAASTSHLQVIRVKSYEESETPCNDTVTNEASNSRVTSELSGFSPSAKKEDNVESSSVVDGTQKPPMVIIPTAEVDMNLSNDETYSSISKDITNDFDFSSVSLHVL